MRSILSGRSKRSFRLLLGTIVAIAFVCPSGMLWACSICFYGDPRGAMSRELIGLTGGIATLLGILSLVLASFAKFFLNVRKRSQVIGEQQSLLQGV